MRGVALWSCWGRADRVGGGRRSVKPSRGADAVRAEPVGVRPAPAAPFGAVPTVGELSNETDLCPYHRLCRPRGAELFLWPRGDPGPRRPERILSAACVGWVRASCVCPAAGLGPSKPNTLAGLRSYRPSRPVHSAVGGDFGGSSELATGSLPGVRHWTKCLHAQALAARPITRTVGPPPSRLNPNSASCPVRANAPRLL